MLGSSWGQRARNEVPPRESAEEKHVDSIRFDGLARELRATDTRRGAVKTLAAAVLGLGVARLGISEADARRKNRRRKNKRQKGYHTKVLGEFCSNNKQCVNGLLCQIANSQNGFPERANDPVCCVPTDVQAKCDSGADCCGVDVICNGGYCQGA